MSPAYFEDDPYAAEMEFKDRREEWERSYGSVERVEWMRSRPSIVSGKKPCVNAHVRTGGMGRKADACWIVPLTYEEHEELHRIGRWAFQAKYTIDLDVAARMVELHWQGHLQTERPAW